MDAGELTLDQLELWDHPLGQQLEDVADQWLTIIEAHTVMLGGPAGPYRRLCIHLADGRRLTTSARQLVDRLGSAPPEVYPLDAMLTVRQSRRHSERTYWALVFR